MKKPKVLVVEDEHVVAADIEDCLKRLGYSVAGSAATALTALRKAVETQPDLVLMDIRLKGGMDGIEAARELHEHLGIPVVFLTAYADAEVLERAKAVSPAGYVLKPFDERSLRAAVELALHSYPRQRSLAERTRRFEGALQALDEAVIVATPDGRVAFLNRAAELLTGWPEQQARGEKISRVLPLVRADGGLAPNVLLRAMQEHEMLELGDEILLVTLTGERRRIAGKVVPLLDEQENLLGLLVRFHACQQESSPAPRACWSSLNLGGLPGRLVNTLSLELLRHLEAASALLRPDPHSPGMRDAVARLSLASQLAYKLLQYASPPEPRLEEFLLPVWLEEVTPLLQLVAGAATRLELRCEEGQAVVKGDRARLELGLLCLLAWGLSRAGRTLEMLPIEASRARLLEAFARTHTCLEPGDYAALRFSFPGEAATEAPAELPVDLRRLFRQAGGDVTAGTDGEQTLLVEVYLPLGSSRE